MPRSDRKYRIKHYVSKKCPSCMTYLSLDTRVCHSCGQKVSSVDSQGIAKKAIGWKNNFICLIAVAALGFFIWWAFFREGVS